MKKISIILLFGLFISSCILKDYLTVTEFEISNLTHSPIRVFVTNFEDNPFSLLDTTFLIQPQASINYYYANDGAENAPYLFPFGSSSDSVIIFYNDTISKTFSINDSTSRNPLDIAYYTGGKQKDGLFKYTYTITNQDIK